MSETIRIGAHVDQADPVAEAQARDTTLVQFFLGDPQSYKGPEIRYDGGADALRTAAESAGIDRCWEVAKVTHDPKMLLLARRVLGYTRLT